jgi:hypothetical protein
LASGLIFLVRLGPFLLSDLENEQTVNDLLIVLVNGVAYENGRPP